MGRWKSIVGCSALVAALAVPARAQTPETVVEHLNAACAAADLERAYACMPDEGVCVDLTKSSVKAERGYEVKLDVEKTESVFRRSDRVHLYHCHPGPSREDWAAIRAQARDSGPFLRTEEFFRNEADFLSRLPTATDIAALVYHAGMFYRQHPDGELRSFIVPVANGIRDAPLVIELSLDPGLDRQLRGSARSLRSAPGETKLLWELVHMSYARRQAAEAVGVVQKYVGFGLIFAQPLERTMEDFYAHLAENSKIRLQRR